MRCRIVRTRRTPAKVVSGGHAVHTTILTKLVLFCPLLPRSHPPPPPIFFQCDDPRRRTRCLSSSREAVRVSTEWIPCARVLPRSAHKARVRARARNRSSRPESARKCRRISRVQAHTPSDNIAISGSQWLLVRRSDRLFARVSRNFSHASCDCG